MSGQCEPPPVGEPWKSPGGGSWYLQKCEISRLKVQPLDKKTSSCCYSYKPILHFHLRSRHVEALEVAKMARTQCFCLTISRRKLLKRFLLFAKVVISKQKFQNFESCVNKSLTLEFSEIYHQQLKFVKNDLP